MKASAKRFSLTLLLLALLVAVPITYSTAHGYTQWWLLSGGHVEVNGTRGGYLHKSWSNSAVIITRTDSSKRQSYLVQLSGSRTLIDCGDWYAPRLPAFPIGDVNPPCMGFIDDPDLPDTDRPLSSSLITRPGFVEFSTVQGKKVTVSW
jgi:hypothetical protein